MLKKKLAKENQMLLPYSSGQHISQEEIMDLIADYKHAELSSRISGVVAELPTEGTLFVSGDIHGNIKTLQELVNISKITESTAENTHLLLLGDYVDRGKDSLAVVANLMYLKIKFPQKTTFLMGNHETWFLWSWFLSFRKELRQRYGKKEANNIYRALLDAFSCMPVIATSVNGIIATHGGPPKSLQIAGLLGKAIHEMLWTDVSSSKHLLKKRNQKTRLTLRGRNIAINEISKFLLNANKTLLLRGHSHTSKGVDIIDDIVITVVSAPRAGGIKGMFGHNAEKGILELPLDIPKIKSSDVAVRFL